MSHSLVGSTLGNYRIENVLRNTSTGQVYLAHHPNTNLHVEIKVVLDDAMIEAKQRERIERELQILTRIHHPNVIRTWAVGRAGTISYIVMEHIEGRTLASWIDELGRLRWRDAFRLFVHVLRGLEAVHAFEVIHRDVTTENVLLGHDGRVAVGGFSSVKTIGSDGSATSTMATSDLLGNVYIAPEQLSGESVDVRTDIYSAGMCLYHALAAGLPYESSEGVSSLLRRLKEPPRPLRERVPDVPTEVEDAVMPFVAVPRDERYADAVLARNALERVLARVSG